jgi:hypothetical protein
MVKHFILFNLTVKLLNKMEDQEILNAYSNFVVEHNKRPINMAAFAKMLEVDESDIYRHYTSFDSIESKILTNLIENAIELTDKSAEESDNPDSRELLLTFYYTLTEVLKENRSLVLYLFPGNPTSLARLHILKSVKLSFSKFIEKLELTTTALSFIPDHSIKDKALESAAWIQFCSIFLYWLKDESPDFEKTDVFIEKSLRLTFDLVDSNVMKSVVDFGKFIFRKS